MGRLPAGIGDLRQNFAYHARPHGGDRLADGRELRMGLLRGDTAHYDVIVNEVTRGIGQSAQETGVPHAFGVLTCDTLEQAIDRAGLKMGNKGFEAALAAVEMANLKKTVAGRSSLVDGKNKSKGKNKKSKR